MPQAVCRATDRLEWISGSGSARNASACTACVRKSVVRGPRWHTASMVYTMSGVGHWVSRKIMTESILLGFCIASCVHACLVSLLHPNTQISLSTATATNLSYPDGAIL